ncbi:hypothetical protein GQ457_07G004210 [Hibiscus cannabinus]
MLKDDDGCILHENATNYFENFFDCPEPTVPHFPIRGRFPKHSTAELANLDATPSQNEIKEALKSYGVESLHAQFFQQNWDIVDPFYLFYDIRCF